MLKRLFDEYATSWRVLCYLRRPDEHIASQYQQKMRKIDGGSHGTFDSFLTERLSDDYYCYAQHLAHWAKVFGKNAVEVRIFHRETLQGGPLEDFTRWIGLDPERLSFTQQKNVNESVDRVGTEILRVLHTCVDERPELMRGHDLSQIMRKLRALASNDRLRLDAERARLLQERFRKDHERLAKHYLSPEHAAVFLAPPVQMPPQPPINPHVALERAMAVLADPELARLVAAEIVGGASRAQTASADPS